jgi:ABC-type antimicrobial peptide transport system permease subunit
VALAMLERRKEIGVMKAVGATRRGILQFLLLENIVVGFLGSMVGTLLAMAATSLLDQTELEISTSFDPLTIGGLLLLGIGLAIGASALTALPASGEKPMAVLRYE